MKSNTLHELATLDRSELGNVGRRVGCLPMLRVSQNYKLPFGVSLFVVANYFHISSSQLKNSRNVPRLASKSRVLESHSHVMHDLQLLTFEKCEKCILTQSIRKRWNKISNHLDF